MTDSKYSLHLPVANRKTKYNFRALRHANQQHAVQQVVTELQDVCMSIKMINNSHPDKKSERKKEGTSMRINHFPCHSTVNDDIGSIQKIVLFTGKIKASIGDIFRLPHPA